MLTAEYSVQRVLGRGGSGVVHLARDSSGREVACKRVAFGGSTDEIATARRRLGREAEVLRNLAHPGIVPLLDVVDDGDDLVLVMPFYPGGNWSERVAARGPLGAEEFALIGHALARALAYAHANGVVHRDVNPRNVLFDADGTVALADFGIATTLGITHGLTPAGMVVGTPGYLAPEVARGEDSGAAADVYGLGASFAFALGGIDPAKPFSALVKRMMDPDPRRRPSMDHVALTLDASRNTAVTALAPRRLARRLRSATNGRRTAIGAAAIVALGLGVWSIARRDTPAADARSTCAARPYQPCGSSEPAPFTDGTRCIGGHADYDRDAANGCEAAPDTLDGDALAFDTPRVANLVPADDEDSYPITIEDHFHLTCNGSVTVTLTAPKGVRQRVQLREGGDVLAEATSADGVPAVARAAESACVGSDAGTYDIVVTTVSGYAAESYVLEANGSF